MNGRGAMRQLWRTLVLLTAALALVACQSTREPEPAPPAAPPAPAIQSAPISVLLGTAEVRGHSVYVADMATGRALYEENEEALRFPASLTKMMTLFLLFEEVEAGRLALSDELPVSQDAASRPPSKLGLKAGSTIRVTDAAQAMAIKSANDVAVVVAEAISGSEEAFANKMTARARELGMYRTRFVNASGLPDPLQVSTARDMAILGRALVTRFPRFAPYFRAEEFHYNGRRYEATNDLLGKVRGVDGIKTGYIRASGFHLAVSVRRGGRRLIVVVMGGRTGRERDREVTELIDRYM